MSAAACSAKPAGTSAAHSPTSAAATLSASLVVGQFGVIGFVGLLAPHLVRLAFGPVHARLLPLAALFGALPLAFGVGDGAELVEFEVAAA